MGGTYFQRIELPQVLRLGGRPQDLWRTSSYAYESYLGPCKVICKLSNQNARIYRLRVASGDIPVETRTLLLVKRCIPRHVDQELEQCGLKGRVWVHLKPRRTKPELADLHSVIDQAFTVDDPRKPESGGAKGEYFEQFVFTKVPEPRIGSVRMYVLQ